MSKPLILIDNKQTATSYVADVIIPSSITGIETGGMAYRIDHIPLNLKKIIDPPNNVFSDEKIIKKIIKRLEQD